MTLFPLLCINLDVQLQGHNIIEYVMDHLANELGVDPVELRIKNFLKEGDTLVKNLWVQLKILFENLSLF
jgi:CO/xanthine dehydrogenase Mo-binding subunit